MLGTQLLIYAAIASGVASIAHIGCIFFGASWYRFFGAGEKMARMAEQGLWYPTLITAAIASVLALWSCYALSGAGLILHLPLLRFGLCTIAAIYLARGLAVIPMMWFMPGNSLTFWIISSSLCFAIGLLYALGTWQVWPALSEKAI